VAAHDPAQTTTTAAAEPSQTNDGSSCSEGAAVKTKLPLAMFAVERSSKKRLLFHVSSRKIRGIRSSTFPDATCEFENGGWLLMIQHKPPRRQQQQQVAFLVREAARPSSTTPFS
jgi:hypothetical protein